MIKQTSLLVYLKGLTQAEAIAEAKKRKGRILTNKELDDLIQQDILDPDIFPLWVGTHLEYKRTICKIIENGKIVKCRIPEENNWYEMNRFGLPFGKLSSSKNPKARYLWRKAANSSLVARVYGRWYDGLRRYVDAYYDPSSRLGVLMIKR